MSKFASRENTPAEQMAILDALKEHLGAVEVTAPSATGLERARQIAAQAEDYRATPDEPARPNWEQRSMFEEEAA